MADKNDVVIIELDRPRMLWFGHKALKTLTRLTGKDLNASMQMEELDLDELEKIMYCGLLRDAKNNDEILTIEMMEDLLDTGNFMDNIQKMQEAFEAAFGSNEKN